MNRRAVSTAKSSDAKRTVSAESKRSADASPSVRSPAQQILQLQKTVGNQAVQRLIRSGALQAGLAMAPSAPLQHNPNVSPSTEKSTKTAANAATAVSPPETDHEFSVNAPAAAPDAAIISEPSTPAEEKSPAASAAEPDTTVKLHIPKEPAGPSPATRRRTRAVQARAGKRAVASAAFPGGAALVGAARQAVSEPDAEAVAKVQAELMAQVQAAPSPEIVKLCERIREVIRTKRPPDEDALMEAKPEEEALNAGNQLNSTVQSETGKVQENYGGLNNQPPSVAPQRGRDLPPQPAAVEAPPLDAPTAVPDAVPPASVSLDADAADSAKRMRDAGMETPAAQLVQSGPLADARGTQSELEQVAQEEPANVLAGQREALAKAEGDMAALQAQALAALTNSRVATAKSSSSRQKGMVASEESQRAKAGAEAQKVFNDAKSQVTTLLRPLASNAMAEWEAAKELLVSQFKADLAIVQKRVEERHAGVGGFFVGLWDAVTGLPGWAEAAYSKAEKNFGDGVINKLTAISANVNSVIAACDLIIKSARSRIATIFNELPESLKGWAAQEQARFDGQLDQLHQDVIAARDKFNQDLVERSSQAVDEVRTEIAELRKKAGGLVGRIVSAVNRFLEDPVKFIIEGLLDLLGISPAAFWAVVAKIRKFVKEIADDPLGFADNLLKGLGQGFSQFFDNILTHLLKGFISWLTGGLSDVGVQMPKDFSLKSIMTFFLQLMGITWPRIRKILAKHVGEKNVALLEKVYSLVSFLIEKGPEGIYELIKEKLDPQAIVDQVVNLAVDFMISAIVKAVSVRILMLFNPVGAILQALEAIYRVLKWIFQNAARIFTLIETVVNGIGDVLAGSIGGFANAVEKALGMLIAPVISFLADYLGFGDLPSKIAEKIKSFQTWILGLIEKALVWIIEKGKALLAAVGIGGKDKEKGAKKGAGEEQVGEEVDFEADGESHRLWIELSGEQATLMVASTQQTVKQYLSHVQRNGPRELSTKATTAQQLADTADFDADEIAKVAAHVPDKDEEGGRADLTARQETLKGKEKALAELLAEIFEGMNPILPRLGKPVDDIKKSPLGYELWTEVGSYEYGGDYSNIEIQRGPGFGSSDEKSFPKVHVDEPGNVQKEPGLLRSDWPVIYVYETEIGRIKDKLKDDGAPQFRGSPDGPANQLRAGAKKERSFNRGVRKQMEAIVKAIREGAKITGVEVVVGERRVDYTVRKRVAGRMTEVMVEYKHWTGKLSPDRRAMLADKLQKQLEGQIVGGGSTYPILIVQWPAFGDLDSDSQQMFLGVIEDAKEFGLERGVTVKLQS